MFSDKFGQGKQKTARVVECLVNTCLVHKSRNTCFVLVKYLLITFFPSPNKAVASVPSDSKRGSELNHNIFSQHIHSNLSQVKDQ